MSGWQAIDTAPTDGTPVLLFGGVFIRKWSKDQSYTEDYEPTFMVASHTQFGWLAAGLGQCDIADIKMDRPTHWMPLPEIPE